MRLRFAGILAFACVLPAFGTTYVEPCTLSTFSVSMASASASATITCQQFDPSLGTLTDYGFIPNGGGGVNPASMTFQNNGSSEPVGPFLFGFSITAAGTLPGGEQIAMDWVGGLIAATTALSPGSTQTFSSDLYYGGITSGADIPQTASLDSYIGTGQISIPITISAISIATPGQNPNDPLIALTNFSATVGSPSVALIYDASVSPTVPEPATGGLLACSLGVAAFVIRRRKSVPTASN